MSFCARCGTQLADGAKFCAECGQPTGEAIAPAPARGVKNWRRRPLTWIIVVLDAFALLVLVIGVLNLDTPSELCGPNSSFLPNCADVKNSDAVALLVILGITVAVNVILGVVWYITRER